MASGPRVLVNLRLLYLFFVLSCISFCESRPTSNDGTSDVITDTLGNSQVIDPTTDQTIAQGSASDGAGSGLDVPAVLWIAMVFITGLPLLTAGVRGGRLTSGTGAGLALAVAGMLLSSINFCGGIFTRRLVSWRLILLLNSMGGSYQHRQRKWRTRYYYLPYHHGPLSCGVCRWRVDH